MDQDIATPDRPQPVAVSGSRITSLDFIRGIAVMGILAANIFAMGQPFTAYMYPTAFTVPHSAAEGWMWVAQFVLIDGKMRGLFSLLFGAGLYLFMEKTWAKGGTVWLQIKRLLWLGLFGAIHFFFIWRGDILFLYALCGLIAVAIFIGMSVRKQLAFGILAYIVGTLLYGSLIAMQFVADTEVDSAVYGQMQEELLQSAEEDLQDGRLETQIRQDGTYGDYVAHNFSAHTGDLAFVMFFAFETLPLMLFGMVLYRKGLFDGRWRPRSLGAWAWVSLLVGGALTLWIALATKAGGITYYGSLAAFVGWTHIPRLFMVLGLVILLAIHAPTAGGWLSDRITAAGRAAFTNYLGTSIVMLFVFGNWGLDLFGRFGRTELYLVVLASWFVMLLWSKPWLDRFRFGPFEWAWRCLTYGRVFPIRR
ncbi:DUF418 domain-containing protein [Qipengyuania nanhaisediminis]|uniref:DUF418 domain-containing protein n=1 Tax=Qipengyuania nanhaisediminis TaxID=604088 RepID=A0A1I5LLZ1_9SPHN|nr:DUF418 domain-containing protein [Qipengyuania nanhaisediminis]SFO98147.1 uncharacterized protein SAMN04488060_1099 [Qipengyuania nanhaisediminis]